MDDGISLADMVKNIGNGSALIEKWLRSRNAIEFLGIWEEIYNERGYLKADDKKSRRRVFRVDRILEIKRTEGH